MNIYCKVILILDKLQYIGEILYLSNHMFVLINSLDVYLHWRRRLCKSEILQLCSFLKSFYNNYSYYTYELIKDLYSRPLFCVEFQSGPWKECPICIRGSKLFKFQGL